MVGSVDNRPKDSLASFRLYWSSRSPYVRKAMVAAHELGLAHSIETHRVIVAMAKLSAELMLHNPLSKIPTLVLPDGAALFDSRVICEYLDSIAEHPRLFPSGAQRWGALRMQALGDGMMDNVMLRLAETYRAEGIRSSDHIAAWTAKLKAAYDFADRLIASEMQAADGDLHIGHVALGCALGHVDFRFSEDVWREGRPALATWYEKHAARPSMIATAYEDVY